MGLHPLDLLNAGTTVLVGTLIGTVVKHEIVNAVPSGKIAVHTIRFTHRRVRKTNSFGPQWTTVPITPHERQVNYSSIVVYGNNSE